MKVPVIRSLPHSSATTTTAIATCALVVSTSYYLMSNNNSSSTTPSSSWWSTIRSKASGWFETSSASSTSSVATLHQQWQHVLESLGSILSQSASDTSRERRGMTEYHIEEHLNRIIDLLIAEDKKSPSVHYPLSSDTPKNEALPETKKSVRPCWDYFWEKQLWVQVCVLGSQNQPTGMLEQALMFTRRILAECPNCARTLLTNRNVVTHVERLLGTAMLVEARDPVVRYEWIALLHSLWLKVQQDPFLLEMFWKTVENKDSTSVESPPEELSLLSGLLPHMFDPQDAGQMCREALMVAVSLPDPRLSTLIVKWTPMVRGVVSGVITSFEKHNGSDSAEKDSLEEYNLGIRFVTALAMASSLVHHNSAENEITEEKSVAEALITDFADRFLSQTVHRALCATSEDAATSASIMTQEAITSMIQSGVSNCDQNPILFVTMKFLLDSDNDQQPQIKSELLYRIQSMSESLSVATMELFGSMLELNDDYVLQKLILDDCEGDDDSSTAPTLVLSSPTASVSGNALSEFVAAFNKSCEKLHLFQQQVEQNEHMEDIAEYLMDATYAATTRIATSSYWVRKSDELLNNGGNAFKTPEKRKNTSKSIDSVIVPMATLSPAPKAFRPPSPSSIVKTPSSPPGSAAGFITICWERLSRSLNTCSKTSTLVLTGVLVHVAQCPNDTTHSLIYGPELSSSSHEPLVKVLSRVWKEGMDRVDAIENGRLMFNAMRQRMLSDSGTKTGNDDETKIVILPKHVGFFETLVVLEEFIIELASILCAKMDLQAVPLKPEGHYMQPRDAPDRQISPDRAAASARRAVSRSRTFSSNDTQQVPLSSISSLEEHKSLMSDFENFK